MIFSNIHVLLKDYTVCENLFVATKGNRIVYIGSQKPDGEYGDIYDGRGKLLMPAFYNAHSHNAMSLMRGYGENLSLNDWLHKKIFPFEAEMTPQDIYYGWMLCAAEMLRFGIAGTNDMYFSGEAMARAVLDSGVKANLSLAVTCYGDHAYEDLPVAKEADALFAAFDGAADGRLMIDLSIHGEYTSTENAVRGVQNTLRAWAAAYMSICRKQRENMRNASSGRGGMTPAAYFKAAGLFDVPATAAHAVWAEQSDYEIFKQQGVTVATCPKSNLKLASGTAPAAEMLKAGVRVALATDSVASNNNLNMLEEMKILALTQKGRLRDPVVLKPAEAIQMATKNGAAAMRRQSCGYIDEGAFADLTVLDLSPLYMQPLHSLTDQILWSACGTDVVLTMVDGTVLYRDGEYPHLDIEKILFECRRAAGSIASAAASKRDSGSVK